MSTPRQESVLIVEDDFIVAKVIEKNLLELGYDIAGLAATGDDAVTMAGSERPDLVLMDIHLKGLTDGITAAGKIHTSFDIPVVYLTAFSDQPTFERALVTSPYGYIVKPFSRNTLSTTIQIALNRKKAEMKKTDLHFWLDHTVSSLSEGIITIDADDRIILVNQAAELMTGWTNREAYRQPLDQVLAFRDPISGDLFHYDILPVIREGIVGTIPNNSLIIPKRNSPHLIVESFASPIRNKEGSISGAVIVLYPVNGIPVPPERSGRSAGEETTQVRAISIAFEQPAGQAPEPSDPVDAEGWYDRGNYLLFLRRFSDAIDAYLNAVSHNPMSYQSWFGLGTALDKNGEDQKALEAYERALSIYPRNPRILDAKGVLLKKMGKDADAERCFELARLYLA
jgi:CheY-like chemotaxis protein